MKIPIRIFLILFLVFFFIFSRLTAQSAKGLHKEKLIPGIFLISQAKTGELDYNFREIENKWQKFWLKNKTFRAEIDHSRPKYYVLDMFPYPSGSGLHVGHPLGYIASDIYSRYKRLKGFNVLHPMGYDAFGLPAEQYAIQTGTHPAVTTEMNVGRYREQMDKIGFSYDWDREVKTCDPSYYKWTQWTFIRLFKHWYNQKTQKAEPIAELIRIFENSGNSGIDAAITQDWPKALQKKDASFGEKWNGIFTADEWKSYSEKQQQEILMNYRLAFLSEALVNWCPDLGTVLANDEVSNGFSIRGGHPVERKLMRQWFLRISAYAQRLLDGLDQIDFSESLKEMQRNWIGRSEGAEVVFPVNGTSYHLDIFTTRPDTIFGSTFMVIAPEHELAEIITPPERKEAVSKYIHWAKNRSERERMAEVKKISGEFTGAYCINPLNGKKLQIWVADYVLAGYGTGAIMAVPAHDSRDYDFAKHFGLPIVEVVSGGNISENSYDAKDGILVNSGFINGMNVKEAIQAVVRKLEETGIGKGTVNFRLRDAIFSRQRYWGEPFPVYFRDDIPYVLDESVLPFELPEVDKYLPTETGDPPLARAKNWKTKEGYPYETNTMPGFAGSSGYYLRYMDPGNDKEYFSKEAASYWKDVDLYIGGSEHATGHLIYARFWNKFLFDMGLSPVDEPFKKLINQGMIQGVSQKACVMYQGEINSIVGYIIPQILSDNDKKLGFSIWVNIPIEYVDDNNFLTKENLELCKMQYKQFSNLKIAVFNDVKGLFFSRDSKEIEDIIPFFDENRVELRPEVEKMSKSKFNVVNPDELIDKYGADTLRLYEMFLGPLEQSKPWDTHGVEGVFRFLRKFWKLFHDIDNNFKVTDDAPLQEELKILHKTIKKVQEDIERFSFNTAVSSFMICTNELSELKCNKKGILEPLVILISPYAPHLAEELWEKLGHGESISGAVFPEFNKEYLVEDTFTYPVSFNGKLRFQLTLPLDMNNDGIEIAVREAQESQKWLTGKTIKKFIIVPGKIINIVVS
jgi:leucyl-tRNA synthetase